MDVLPTRISQYEIRHVLGQGGMGTVYLAVDPALQRAVALKVLRTDGEELRERFRREARLIARLQHPNIVAIYAVGEHEEQPFLAMEYIEGEPLSEGIRRRAPWSLQRKLMMAVDVCAGLAFAHRAGVIHRDVKPSNLMVSNGSGVVRLLDFGIARGDDAAATNGLTLHGNIVGTMNYMSPEQITGQPVDHRSDIFAVGLVLYELLSYCQAFPGSNLATLTYRIVHGQAEPLRDVEPTLDAELCSVVDRAMARRPEDRYPHLEALRTDLLRIASRPSPTEAAALALEGTADRPAPPSAPQIWSRALDPTIDSGAPVTPGSTAPLRGPAEPPPSSPSLPGSHPPARLLIATSGALALVVALGVGWFGWRELRVPPTPAAEDDGPTSPRPSDRPVVTAPPASDREDRGRPTDAFIEPPANVAASSKERRAPERRSDTRPLPRDTAAETVRRNDAAPGVEPNQPEQRVEMPPAPLPVPSPDVPPREEPPSVGRADVSVLPQPVTGPSDSEQVQGVITRWARAYAARDARGIEAVMPGAEPTYARQFSGLRSARTSVAGCQVTVDGTRATATCTEQFDFELTVGGGNRGSRQRRFVLDRSNGEWRIVSTGVGQ